MKKIVLIVVAVTIMTNVLSAQNNNAEILKEILKELSPKQKIELFHYAQKEQELDKEIMKIMKKLPKDAQSRVVEMAQDLQSYDYIEEAEVVETRPIGINPVPIPANVGVLAKLTLETPQYDFGEAIENEKVEHIFKFTNDSENPLIISNARGSCGCTVPEWSRDPIAPGESSEIKVVFDTKGKVGKQIKTVTITANTEPVNTTIRLTGTVLKKE